MRALLLTAFLAGAPCARAAESLRFQQMTESEITAALKKIHAENPDLRNRVEAVSAAFLGTAYKLGPLGEGDPGEFDRDPLYSFSAVDCTTVIEQVMALSIEPDLKKALAKTLQRIRYKNGRIDYASRNHFTEADWIPNNIAAGFLKDITREIAGSKAQEARKLISKRQWYRAKTI